MKNIKLVVAIFILVAFFSGTSLAADAGQNDKLANFVKQELSKGKDLSLILDGLTSNSTIEPSVWNSVIKTSLESGISLKEIFSAADRIHVEPIFISQRLIDLNIPATVVFAALEKTNFYSDRKEALNAFNAAMTQQKLPLLSMESVKKADNDALGYTPSGDNDNADQDALGYTPAGLDKNPALSKVARVVLPPAAASSNPNAGSFASPSTF